MLRVSGTTFIIIDALDECPKAERTLFFPLLEKLCGLGVDLHVLVTSRPEPDIKYHLSSIQRSTHPLSLHDTPCHLETLESYVSTQLLSWEYSDWPEAIKKKVQRILVDKSNGM